MDTGEKTAGIIESNDWTLSFTVAQIQDLDNLYAVAGGDVYLEGVVSNFSLGIPGDAIITGIEATASFKCNVAKTAFIRVSLSPDGGTTWTATKEVSVRGTTRQTKTLGGAADTWGRAWSAAELDDGTLWVNVEGKAEDINACMLDQFTLKVYYENGAGNFFLFFGEP